MAQQLARDLYQLDIPLVGSPLRNLNGYLILGERSLLIDTGFRQAACLEALEQELTQLGVCRETLDIFVTHLHSDHLGLAPQVIRPGGRVYLGRTDLDFLKIYGTAEGWHQQAQRDVLDGFSQEEVTYLWNENPAKTAGPLPYDGYVPVDDGQVFRYGDYCLQAVETPGHTPGHLCLYDQTHKRLFTGDHVLFKITPNICRWPGVRDSLGAYLQSLAKVSLLDVEQVHTGHRHDTGDFQHRIAQLQAHHQERLADTLEAVTRCPGQTAYALAGELRWSIRAKNWADFPLTQKFFAVGETLAHLDYLACRGQVVSAFDGAQYVWHLTK